MVKLHLELEGEVGEVVRVLRRIGGGDHADGEVRDGLRLAPTEERTAAVGTVPEPGTTTTSATLLPGHWTEELAADFTAGLDVVARRVMFQVWRAGERGSHRDVLCQRADLTPVELRSLLIRMGPRAGEVPAGAGPGAAQAGGGQQPVAELFHRPRLRRGGVRSVRGEDAVVAGLRRGAPWMDSRRWPLGRAKLCIGCGTC